MRSPEEWPSRGSNPADRIRLTGPAAFITIESCRSGFRLSPAESISEIAFLDQLLTHRSSKAEPYLCCNSSWRKVVRSAKSGKKVVQPDFIRQVDHRNLRRPLALISMEQVVVPNCQIEHVSRRNPGRVSVVIFRSWSRYRD